MPANWISSDKQPKGIGISDGNICKGCASAVALKPIGYEIREEIIRIAECNDVKWRQGKTLGSRRFAETQKARRGPIKMRLKKPCPAEPVCLAIPHEPAFLSKQVCSATPALRLLFGEPHTPTVPFFLRLADGSRPAQRSFRGAWAVPQREAAPHARSRPFRPARISAGLDTVNCGAFVKQSW